MNHAASNIFAALFDRGKRDICGECVLFIVSAKDAPEKRLEGTE